MITTECKPLNWMINKASEYYKSSEHTVYRFYGNVRYSMVQEVNAWMKSQGAHYDDGRTRSGYGLVIEDSVDVVNHWYKHIGLRVTHGSTYNNANNVEVMITIYDCPVDDKDFAELMASEKVQKV